MRFLGIRSHPLVLPHTPHRSNVSLRPPALGPQVIASIEERLASLEAETAEFAEFSRLDRERRALEYVLYRRGACLTARLPLVPYRWLKRTDPPL